MIRVLFSFKQVTMNYMIDIFIENENNTKITSEAISNVEGKYKVKLPRSYSSLLKIQNGGYTHDLVIPGYEDHFSVSYISGIQGNKNDTLEESDYYINEWELPKNLLLFSGDGHWWLAFDYRKMNENNEPKISYIDTEIDRDEVIANSFDEFLNLLKKYES